MRDALFAALLLGVVSTIGDAVWAEGHIRHRVVYGLLHGAALCLCIGAFIGVRAGRPAAGALAGPLVGLLAAGGFYLLAPTMGIAAMFPMWMLFWICFGLLEPALRGVARPMSGAGRGIVAALFSGAAFWAISGIWTRPSPGGPSYAWHFACWTFAFLPGFLALFAAARTPALPARGPARDPSRS
jgi:hypothetical protein